MKTELNEIEYKYLVDVNTTQKENWEKEHIVFQWYEINENNFESKIKLIIDLETLIKRFVRVEKKRITNLFSEKTVEYLDFNDIYTYKLLNLPFIAKRRSINNNLFLDKMIHSKISGKYLLEKEDDVLIDLDKGNLLLDGITNFKDVSENINFRNSNLSIPFKENHYNEMITLLNFLS